MNDGKVDWRGNMPAMVTPFTRDGEIDMKAFAHVAEWLLDQGAAGLVVSGCTGEAWSIEGHERLRLFARAVEIARGRGVVIGGTGGIVTSKVAELSREAKATGVDGVMIVPPYYAEPTPREVVAHFRRISDEARVPIMLYNIPPRIGVDLTPELVEQLAPIEWVVAIKESGDDFVQVEKTLRRVGDRILVFSGYAAVRGVAATAIGCAGLISSKDAHIIGRDAIAMYDLVKAGRIEEAMQAQMQALDLVSAISGIASEAAVVKGAMNLLGRPGGHVREPLLDADPAELERLAAVLENQGYILAKAS